MRYVWSHIYIATCMYIANLVTYLTRYGNNSKLLHDLELIGSKCTYTYTYMEI